MATVTLAQDTLLGREVALKRLSGTHDRRSLSRLRREALVGASISHPNLVSIYDVITVGAGDVIIVMEYVAGETLGDRLAREGALPGLEALRILEGVAAGLDAIHRRHIVHRDVKPANILLGHDGAVKLTDLGVAAAPDRTQITTAGTLLGSFAYMAPEQLDDAPATPRVDVYALGAVAFEALSGRRARRETHPLAVAHAIATQPPPDLREAWPGAPAGVAALIRQAMARDPRRRPRSPGDFVTRLGAELRPPPALGAATATVRPTGARALRARTAAGSPTSRRGVRWAVIAAPLAVAAALLASLLLVNRSSPGSGTGGSNAAGVRDSPRSTTAFPRPASRSATTGASSSATGSPAGTGEGAATAVGAAAGVTSRSSGSSGSLGAGGSAGSSGSLGAGGSAGSSGGAGSGAGSATPASAVQRFYTLAAGHDISAAWALADPTLRAQLGGYESFRSEMAGDRSITFHSARVISQSSSAATVAISTTSVRDDGTQQCSGTVDVAAGGGGWRLHLVHISCRS
jgi:serine/threonine-protein kinase